MRAYVVLIRTGLMEAMAYRAQLLIALLLALVPLIMMAVWLTVVDQAGPAADWNKADFVSYYVGAAAVFQFANSYGAWGWQRDIRNGDLSSRLLKPLDPFHFYLCQNLGGKVLEVVIFTPVLVLATLLIPELRFALTPVRLVVFIVSLLAAFLLSTFMGTTFGIIAFWTTQGINLYLLWFGIGQFLSGWMAPLAL